MKNARKTAPKRQNHNGQHFPNDLTHPSNNKGHGPLPAKMLKRLGEFLLGWGRPDLSDAITALNTQAMDEFRGATHHSKPPQRLPMPEHSNGAYDSYNGGRPYPPYAGNNLPAKSRQDLRRTRSTPNLAGRNIPAKPKHDRRRSFSTPNHGFPQSPHTMTSPHKLPTDNYPANAAVHNEYNGKPGSKNNNHHRDQYDYQYDYGYPPADGVDAW